MCPCCCLCLLLPSAYHGWLILAKQLEDSQQSRLTERSVLQCSMRRSTHLSLMFWVWFWHWHILRLQNTINCCFKTVSKSVAAAKLWQWCVLFYWVTWEGKIGQNNYRKDAPEKVKMDCPCPGMENTLLKSWANRSRNRDSGLQGNLKLHWRKVLAAFSSFSTTNTSGDSGDTLKFSPVRLLSLAGFLQQCLPGSSW